MTTKTETKKKTWVTRYGSPKTRKEVEHDEGDCAACVAVGRLDRGAVVFIEEEVDSATVVRRVEGVCSFLGIACLSCRIVSRQDADREIAEHAATKGVEGAEPTGPLGTIFSPLGTLFKIGRMVLDPGYMAYEAAKLGARYGAVVAKHDPCTGCGHGRLLHKRQNDSDPETRARDEALSPTQCRHGRYPSGAPCSCECWRGVETPVPSFESIVKEASR